MATRLRALGNSILVRLPKEEVVSPGGIVLPGRGKTMIFAEAVSVGPGWGKDSDQPPCKEGDTVLLPNYYDDNVLNIEDEKYVFTDFHTILAVKEFVDE
jgi:co-chaperonin GroES (HSP10)